MTIEVIIYTVNPFLQHRFSIPCSDIEQFEHSLKEDRWQLKNGNKSVQVTSHIPAYERYLASKKEDGNFAFWLYGEGDDDKEKCRIFSRISHKETVIKNDNNFYGSESYQRMLELIILILGIIIGFILR